MSPCLLSPCLTACTHKENWSTETSLHHLYIEDEASLPASQNCSYRLLVIITPPSGHQWTTRSHQRYALVS